MAGLTIKINDVIHHIIRIKEGNHSIISENQGFKEVLVI